jgi:hypothetical protein
MKQAEGQLIFCDCCLGLFCFVMGRVWLVVAM